MGVSCLANLTYAAAFATLPFRAAFDRYLCSDEQRSRQYSMPGQQEEHDWSRYSLEGLFGKSIASDWLSCSARGFSRETLRFLVRFEWFALAWRLAGLSPVAQELVVAIWSRVRSTRDLAGAGMRLKNCESKFHC